MSSLSDQDNSWEAGHYLPRMHTSVNPWGSPSKDFWCYDVKFSDFGLFTTHSVMGKLLDFFHTFPREWRGYHSMICSLPVSCHHKQLLGCLSKGFWYFKIYKFKTKNKPSSIRISLPPLIWRRRQWHPTPVLLPGKSHGWRSLVGCSPWSRWGSDMTERLHFHFSPFTFMHWRRKWQPTPVFLPGES